MLFTPPCPPVDAEPLACSWRAVIALLMEVSARAQGFP